MDFCIFFRGGISGNFHVPLYFLIFRKYFAEQNFCTTFFHFLLPVVEPAFWRIVTSQRVPCFDGDSGGLEARADGELEGCGGEQRHSAVD